jgi:phenylalanyl-tRNA synthetase alpha chain
MIDRVAELREEAEAAIAAASTSAELEELRIRFLGRKAELPNLLRGVRDLPPEQRGPAGKAANQARVALEGLIDERARGLSGAELDRSLASDRVDVTLPGDPPLPVGRLHLLTQTRREIEDVFLGLGFSVEEGPEVEEVHYNFDALNHSPTHPARWWTDTFYVSEDPDHPESVVLRTHTSPMQVRAMEAKGSPPIYIVVPGRVFRRDSDATHTPQFHQVEGLAIDEGITLADLKGTLLSFSRAMFGADREVRLRTGYFPFTEPSVEVDVSCFQCDGGTMPDDDPRGSASAGHMAASGTPRRCSLCKGTGWLEILGAGMVHPNVLRAVRGGGFDPEKVQGFAFGMGVERIAMLKHEVPDLRIYFENDVRFLEQFG